MEIVKKVQFLSKNTTDSNLQVYDFLDNESNLPFTIYSPTKLEQYEKLEAHRVYDLKFKLVLAIGDKKVVWKVKGC